MRRSELLQGLRAMKFENIYGRFEGGELSQCEAGELLGVGERTFRRWCHRYREEGEDGLRDRRIGTAAANRVAMRRRIVWRRCIGSGIVGSRRSTFTITWVGRCGFTGATRGRSCSCSVAGCWRRHPGVARTAASARAGRYLA